MVIVNIVVLKLITLKLHTFSVIGGWSDCSDLPHPIKPHHEVATDVGLEDLIEGTLGKGTVLEVEDLRHVAPTEGIFAGALQCNSCLWVVGCGSQGGCAGRVEHTSQGYVHHKAFWITGVGHSRSRALRL